MLQRFLPAALALLLLTGVAPPDAGKSEPVITPVQQNAIKIEPRKPMDLTWQQQQDVFRYGNRAMLDQCLAQPSNLWCKNGLKLEEKTLTAWEIMNISLATKSKFHYTSDREDSWRVHSASVLINKDWYGDCDDLTSTTLDIMIRNGQPRSKVWFVLASVEHKGALDHLIGMIQDADGHFWIIGDTSAQNAYPVSQLKYRVVGVASADKPYDWFDPRYLGAFPASTMQEKPILPDVVLPRLEFKTKGGR